MLPRAIAGILFLALIGAIIGLVTVYQNLQASQSTLSLTTDELEANQEALDNSMELNQDLATTNEELVAKIQEQAAKNNQLEATISDLVAESRRIYEEVQRVEGLNTALDQDIRDVTVTNNSLSRENRTLVTKNSRFEADNESLSRKLAISVGNARTLQEDNDRQALDIRALEEEKTTLQATVKDLEVQNRLLDQQNSEQTSTIQTLEQEETRLNSVVAELRSQNQSLTQLNETYRSKSGTINQLNTRIDSLRVEISRLEDRRKPLLVESFRTNFRCTGSMEPKITCLDSATYVENFRPQDIVVGTVISFDPPATCKLQSSEGVSHRVAKVKVDRGTHYYWPKGDNNRDADGCWVSEKQVEGYVIELHKNTRPQNAELRNLVNSADAAAERVWEVYQAKRRTYGCYDPNRVCTVSSRGQFNELTRLRVEYIAAAAYRRCWVNSARTALYSTFGPPVYSRCIRR